jgi:hypothetical protein
VSSKLFDYCGITYPSYICHGNAAKYIFPFAEQFCSGNGLDIGGTIKCHFPGSKIINIISHDGYDALHLPPGPYDYIFSSHCLEHIPNWKHALYLWHDYLIPDSGILFLYLPHPDMLYWHPDNCSRHLHVFTPLTIVAHLKKIGFKHVINSERDLYWSFSVIAFT